MSFLTNTWINYIQRSYQQIKSQVLTQMQSRVPEITDHSESNIFVKMISIWAGIAEMLGYYIDNAAREAHLPTARLYKSGIQIARTLDYRVSGKLPASADILFTLSAPAPFNITIPQGTEVKTDDGVRFFTSAPGVILATTTQVTVSAVQAVLVTGVSLGNSNGLASQELVLADNVVNQSIVIRVNALTWNAKDTLGFSLPNATDFVGTVNEDKNIIVRFGDNLNGMIPTNGDPIETDYKETEGEAGNVSANTITTIVSVIALPGGFTLVCNNAQRASGGAEVESLESLKRRIPISNRTLNRAVTRADYADVAILSPGVAQAGVAFACGKSVDIYIVPDGGGIASGALVASTQTFMDDKKMITTQVTIYPAGEVHLILAIDLRVLPAYNNVTVANAVKANLVAFLSFTFQSIQGKVELSDLYDIIENTEGVDNDDITTMLAVPYARPLDSVTPVLNWSRAINPASNSTIVWKIKFINPTDYQLFRGGVYIGNFTIGGLVSQTEINFTVNAGAYIVDNEWEFYTYASYGTLTLAEPSLPISLAGDITITATGGV